MRPKLLWWKCQCCSTLSTFIFYFVIIIVTTCVIFYAACGSASPCLPPAISEFGAYGSTIWNSVPVSICWCEGNSQCLVVRSVTIVHGSVWNNHNNYKQWWLFINIRIWFYIKMLRFTEYQESVSAHLF